MLYSIECLKISISCVYSLYKYLYLFCCLTIFSSTLNGQNIDWIKSFEGATTKYVTDINTNGNSFFAGGSFVDSIHFDSSGNNGYIIDSGGFSGYIVEYDLDGNYIWSHSFLPVSKNGVWNIKLAFDVNDNLIESGVFRDSVYFFNQGQLIVSSSNSNVFVNKIDENKNLVWTKLFTGSGFIKNNSLITDKFNNIYFCGLFLGQIDFDPDTSYFPIQSNITYEPFIVKLDSNGTLIWVRNFKNETPNQNPPRSSEISDLVLDDLGNLYFSGRFFGQMDLNSDSTIIQLASSGNITTSDIFYGKLDSNGNNIWTKHLTGTGQDWAKAMVIDSAGNLYMAGQFQNNIDFDADTGYVNYSITGFDGFLLKVDSNGNYINALTFEGSGISYLNDIQIIKDSVICVVGRFLGACDLDPGIASNIVNTIDTDGFFSLLDLNGNYLKSGVVGGSGIPGGQNWQSIDWITSDILGDFYMASEVIEPGFISFEGDSCQFEDGTILWYRGIFMNKISSVKNPRIQNVLNLTNDSICRNNNYDLMVNGSINDAFDWHWFVGECGGTQIGIGDTINFQFTQDTTIYVQGRGGGVIECCCFSKEFKVSKSILSINQIPDSICHGDSVLLEAFGIDSVFWNVNVINGSYFVPDSSQFLQVTSEDSIGCHDTINSWLTVVDYPTTDLGNDTLLCTDQILILRANFPQNQQVLWLDGSNDSILIVDTTFVLNYGNNIWLEVGNYCKIKDSIEVNFTNCNNLRSRIEEIFIRVYPNPSKDLMNIEISPNSKESFSFSILDSRGSILKQYYFKQENKQLNISFLPSGIYFYELKSESGVYRGKFIKD